MTFFIVHNTSITIFIYTYKSNYLLSLDYTKLNLEIIIISFDKLLVYQTKYRLVFLFLAILVLTNSDNRLYLLILLNPKTI